MDALGNLYGTTQYGGASFFGVAYKLDTTGNETVLYSFTGGVTGANPSGGLIQDPSGNLYGAASGGTESSGVVFKIVP